MAWTGSCYVIAILIGAVLGLLLRIYFKTSVAHLKSHNLPLNNISLYIFSTICLLAIIILPILISLLLLFIFYRFLIYLALKLKYKSRFKGFLSGRDVIWRIEDKSTSILNALLILEERENLTKSIFETVKESAITEVINENLKNTKIHLRVEHKFGYLYHLKDRFNLEDCITEFDTDDDPHKPFMTHEGLRVAISKLSNKPLPFNHTVYIEFLVGKRPIIWRDGEDKKCFALLIRIHHSLGDGISLLNIITKCFLRGSLQTVQKNGNFQEEQNFSLENNVKKREKPLKYDSLNILKQLVTEYGKMVGSFFTFAIFLLSSLPIQIWLRSSDKNPLHGPELSGKKVLFWKIEEQESLVQVVKQIKNRVHDARFTDVILTAFSASFQEFFKKKTKQLPKYISGVMPARMEFESAEQLQKQKFTITNNFTVALLNMPITIDGTNYDQEPNNYLTLLLKETIKQTHSLKKSIDFHVNYWSLSILNAFIPTYLIKYFYKLPQYTLFISNLPGPKVFSILSQLPVRDTMFWLPNRGYVGLGISCLSYDNRFQFGLIVDEALTSAEDNMQEILDNVPKYIKALEKEIC